VFWWTLVRFALFLIGKVLYRLRLSGGEHVPHTGPIIFLSNHQSHFDPPLVGILVGDRPFAAIARQSLFKFPLGPIIRSIGSVAIDRDRGDTGAIKAALAELDAGRCVLIFPEGTRSRDGSIGEFQRGVMLLIKRAPANVSIVPVAVDGSHDAWPPSQRWPRLRGRIAVTAAPPISRDELMRDGSDDAARRLRSMIQSLQQRLRHQRGD
jgi:1-acyl-sn-glycerol-3-phosphate acyltransferase